MKMEITVLQRRGNAMESIHPVSPSTEPPATAAVSSMSGIASNLATLGTKTTTTEEKNVATSGDASTAEDKSQNPNEGDVQHEL